MWHIIHAHAETSRSIYKSSHTFLKNDMAALVIQNHYFMQMCVCFEVPRFKRFTQQYRYVSKTACLILINSLLFNIFQWESLVYNLKMHCVERRQEQTIVNGLVINGPLFSAWYYQRIQAKSCWVESMVHRGQYPFS